LLEAADTLIHEQGFPSLRIEEIVERAKLSIGAFYLYFESKDDLFINLVIENIGALQCRLEVASKTAGLASRTAHCERSLRRWARR
jgi:AcrR family transcriptional regulator